MKRTILILANNDLGLYKFRKELLQGLLDEDYEVHISVPKGEFVAALESIGCIITETTMDRRGTNPITDLKLLLNYRKIIKNIEPDVVLTYTIKPNIYGGIASRLTKTPYIANITGLGTAIENKGFMQKITLFLYKLSLKKANIIFFQNKVNQHFFVNRKITNSKTRLIPGSGVNIEQFKFKEYPSDQETINILFIGRMMKSKGVNELLECAQEIKRQFPSIEFHLVGPKEENYTSILEKYTKENIIKYHGRQKDVSTFINDAHVIINPSHHEGMSNVLLEAASSGRPVIASNIPGCKETFDEGQSGFSFEVKNSKSLTDTVRKFIKLSHDEKKKMGEFGREKIEREFNRSIVIDAYLEEINEIMNGEK